MADDPDTVTIHFKLYPVFVMPLFGVCRSCGWVWPGTWINETCPQAVEREVPEWINCGGRVRFLTDSEAQVVELAYRLGGRKAVTGPLRFGTSV